jgi:hypothetical protein
MLLGKYLLVVVAVLILAWMIGGVIRDRTRRR